MATKLSFLDPNIEAPLVSVAAKAAVTIMASMRIVFLCSPRDVGVILEPVFLLRGLIYQAIIERACPITRSLLTFWNFAHCVL